MNDHDRCFTFRLCDGRRATFAGLTEEQAFNRAYRVHGAAVEQIAGESSSTCTCTGDKHAESVRQGGWLVCRDCAGLIGASS